MGRLSQDQFLSLRRMILVATAYVVSLAVRSVALGGLPVLGPPEPFSQTPITITCTCSRVSALLESPLTCLDLFTPFPEPSHEVS